MIGRRHFVKALAGAVALFPALITTRPTQQAPPTQRTSPIWSVTKNSPPGPGEYLAITSPELRAVVKDGEVHALATGLTREFQWKRIGEYTYQTAFIEDFGIPVLQMAWNAAPGIPRSICLAPSHRVEYGNLLTGLSRYSTVAEDLTFNGVAVIAISNHPRQLITMTVEYAYPGGSVPN